MGIVAKTRCHRTAIDPLVATCRVDVARDGDLHRRMRHRQSLMSWPMIWVLISVIVRRLMSARKRHASNGCLFPKNFSIPQKLPNIA
jgi:hypothetical protein